MVEIEIEIFFSRFKFRFNIKKTAGFFISGQFFQMRLMNIFQRFQVGKIFPAKN
jgi:hypothetical protein